MSKNELDSRNLPGSLPLPTRNLIGAVDQGTSSSRFMVFCADTGSVVASHQIPVRTRSSQPGWSEQDPKELLNTVVQCIDETVDKLNKLNIDPASIKAIGLTNQRETTIVWDKKSGEPLYPAILWSDNRTENILNRILKKKQKDSDPSDETSTQAIPEPRDIDQTKPQSRDSNQTKPRSRDQKLTEFKHKVLNPQLFEFQFRCGLPFSTYFSALKLVWLKENLPSVREKMDSGDLMFGTVDTWLIWNLTGGRQGGLHITDVTNASRTLLMNLHTLEWDPFLLEFFQLPKTILPQIRTSSERYGDLKISKLRGVPITGCIGDQQAALLGHQCLGSGDTKTTYGTGCFLLSNIGTSPIIRQGLLTTVAYKLGDEPAHFAVEGSIGQAGSALALLESWGIDKQVMESASSSGGVLALPAYTGLLAPRWRPEMRGVFAGISSFTQPQHLYYAIMEAIAFQVRELTDCINKTGARIEEILVDGGLSQSNKLMQMQADILGITVVRPSMLETTALGAAIVAGRSIGLWKKTGPGEVPVFPTWKLSVVQKFRPAISREEREGRYKRWLNFVESSLSQYEQTPDPSRRDSENEDDPQLAVKIFALSSFTVYLVAEFFAGKFLAPK